MISLILNTLLIKNNVTIYTTLIILLLIYNKFEFIGAKDSRLLVNPTEDLKYE